jgi:MYXO-CTERM domain-containing protein
MLGKRLRLGHLIGGLLLALTALSAQADFAGDITVRLLAPGGVTGNSAPIDVSQTVAFADLATGVQAGNLGGSGDVSSFMLDNERIFFSGTMILMRVAVGDATGGVLTTGYLGSGSEHARYQFDGISFTGRVITGILVYAYDGFATSGPASASGLLSPADPVLLVHQVDADSITFDLDTLVFKQRFAGESDNYAEFRIDLLTSPVPEPAAWLLLAAGLLPVLRRRHGSA